MKSLQLTVMILDLFFSCKILNIKFELLTNTSNYQCLNLTNKDTNIILRLPRDSVYLFLPTTKLSMKLLATTL